MVLESTMICVDNSDYMRNGDFVPTRLHAQQDAVNLLCRAKTRSNPENSVGLLTLANVEVLATLTTDVGKILSKLHQVQPNGDIKLQTGLRVAHLVLKHRQGRNHKLRIVAFVGSPIVGNDKDLIKLAKRLKKEKVNVDIVNLGEEITNTDILTEFVKTLNGKDGASSHLVTVSAGSQLSDALVASPIIQGEDGNNAPGFGVGGFEFGFDANDDPELALALRISMEEQRHQEQARRTQNTAPTIRQPVEEADGEEAMLEQALALPTEAPEQAHSRSVPVTDFANMSEEEQIALAMQMSLLDAQEICAEEQPKKEEVFAEDDEEYLEVMNDPGFLQSVLENLPGVDSDSEAIRQAVGKFKDKKKDDKNEKK